MNSEKQLRENAHDLRGAVSGQPLGADVPPIMLLDRLMGGLPLPTYDMIRRHGVVPPLQHR